MGVADRLGCRVWLTSADPAFYAAAPCVRLAAYTPRNACQRPSSNAAGRTGNAVEYLICSIAKLELTSNSGTARISCL